jgi:hypothetical protein
MVEFCRNRPPYWPTIGPAMTRHALARHVPEGPGVIDPVGKLLFTILAAFAQFERDLIRERTKDRSQP